MTSQLVKLYNQALKKGDKRNYEIVLVGYDKDAKSHAKYMQKSKLPFPGLKMDSKEKLEDLLAIGAENWVPNAALITASGKLVTNDPEEVMKKLGVWSAAAN